MGNVSGDVVLACLRPAAYSRVCILGSTHLLAGMLTWHVLCACMLQQQACTCTADLVTEPHERQCYTAACKPAGPCQAKQ